MQEKLYNILMQKDEITWQTIIYDLVRTGEMDPWDIDISILSQRYTETIKTLQGHNFFLSGKVLLASAILLKLKSERLITEYIARLDNQLFPQEEFFEESGDDKRIVFDANPRLTIKTPQARKKKVSINDLISALEKAMEVNQRRIIKRAELERIPDNLIIPEKKIDINQLIKEIYNRILNIFKKQQTLTFTQLVGNGDKEEKIKTFIPLLHLDTQEKINLDQEKAFEEINITLKS